LHWKWDPNKDRINRQKHLVSFDTAILALNHPLSVTDDDPYPWEPRQRTTGIVNSVLLVVVHTKPEFNSRYNVEVGRIISARRATPHERRIYEEH
jgi:uncharacterized DUF497 family protein